MPKLHITKSILIDAPVDRVYPALNDFNHWAEWSPWLIQEPEAIVRVSDDAKYYAWEGDRIGSGNMRITAEKENDFIDYDLTFLKPWKSSSKVRFELEPQKGSTKVTWLMDSSLPFFLFWMKKSMIAYIGMDYERGLAMLKDYAEDGEVHSKLDFKGVSEYPGCTYIGIQTDCAMDQVGPRMEEDLTKLGTFLSDREELVAAPPFSMYHKWDAVRRQIAYTSAFPVNSIPGDLPAGFITGEIPATKVYTLVHTGPYDHLGNAWSTLYNMQRNKVFKLNKKVNPFEVYISDPGEVPGEKLVTEVHFPVRG